MTLISSVCRRMSALPARLDSAHRFPAGEYVVSDPSLVLSPAAWQHVVYTLMDNSTAVAVEYKGRAVFIWMAQGGEGTYPLYDNKQFRANVRVGTCLMALAPIELFGMQPSWGDSELKELDGVGFYTTSAPVAPTALRGNAQHGPFEVVTNYPELGIGGDGYETQEYEDFGTEG